MIMEVEVEIWNSHKRQSLAYLIHPTPVSVDPIQINVNQAENTVNEKQIIQFAILKRNYTARTSKL
jgi:hypothetical protein